jgi:hypothetical protein
MLTSLARKPLLFILTISFYVLIVGLALQKFIVPTFFKDLAVLDGVLSIDTITFDTVAKLKAIEIINSGWLNWELRPDGHSPAGIASVMYVFFGLKPESMLPLNALIHGLTAYLVLIILQCFFTPLCAVIGALVFALNPFSFEWTAQIHRDGIFILGNLLILYQLSLLIPNTKSPIDQKIIKPINVLVLLLLGTVLVWVARPLWVSILLILSIVVLSISLIGMRAFWRWSNKIKVNLVLVLLIIFQLWLGFAKIPDNEKTYNNFMEKVVISSEIKDQSIKEPQQYPWSYSNWLPIALQTRFLQLSVYRRNSIDLGGGTAIDHSRQFRSVPDILSYVPRALFVGLFSPFPNHWGGEASTAALKVGRRVMGIFTFFSYPCFAGLFMLLVQRRDYKLWLLVLFCVIQIVILAIAFANVGTLMRYRFGFHNLLVALGFAALFSIIFEKLKSRKILL